MSLESEQKIEKAFLAYVAREYPETGEEGAAFAETIPREHFAEGHAAGLLQAIEDIGRPTLLALESLITVVEKPMPPEFVARALKIARDAISLHKDQVAVVRQDQMRVVMEATFADELKRVDKLERERGG